MKLQATYVSADEFDDQHFQISFDTEDPDADLDLSAPLKPYLLIQRQFEGDDGGVWYIETHEPDKYAGHFRLRLTFSSIGRISKRLRPRGLGVVVMDASSCARTSAITWRPKAKAGRPASRKRIW